MKRCFLVLLCLLLTLFIPLALAEDTCSIGDPSSVSSINTACSYINIDCFVQGSEQVLLTITGPTGECVYQRDYGICDAPFRTEDIYLRLNGSSCDYQVSLVIGDRSYAFTITRTMGRLTDNAACTVGYPLSALNGSNTWRSVTLVDVQALEGGELFVPIHASGAYTLGKAQLSVSGGYLTVSAWIDDGIDGSIDSATVYIATNALSAQSLGTKRFSGITGGLDFPIDLGDATYAAVFVNMSVSFDPQNVPASPAITLSGQDDIWKRMQTETTNEAVG